MPGRFNHMELTLPKGQLEETRTEIVKRLVAAGVLAVVK